MPSVEFFGDEEELYSLLTMKIIPCLPILRQTIKSFAEVKQL